MARVVVLLAGGYATYFCLFFFKVFEHNYNRMCGISFFIAYLTFFNRGG